MPRGRKTGARRVVAGVDTHSKVHHVAVEWMNGARIADAQFPATAAGYARMLAWMRSFGRVHAAGVEGTGSYGAGLARYLRSEGVTVIEVTHPDRVYRRNQGKSDRLDAWAAADAVLAGRARAVPKAGDGIAECIRMLHRTRAGAVKARTAALNELRAVLVTAPAGLREHLAGLPPKALISTCAALRPASVSDPTGAAKTALRALARRCQALTAEAGHLGTSLATLVGQAAPALAAAFGIGTETAAQLIITGGGNPARLATEASFAALCGTAPVPASSGKTSRHRLSRGGDRQANRALHMITVTRLAHDPATQAYATRRLQQGKTKPDIIRCLKRYLAREVYKLLTSPNTHTSQLPTAA